MAEAVVIPEAQRLIAESGFCSDAPAGQQQLDGRGGKRNNIKMLPERPAKLSNEDRQAAMKDADEAQRYQRQQEAAQLAADLEDMKEFDRYGRLLEMEMCGVELTGEWRRFMRVYEQMPEFERDRDYWDGQRAALAIIHKSTNPAAGEAAAG